MKKINKILCLILAVAMVTTVIATLVVINWPTSEENENVVLEGEIPKEYVSLNSFFEDKPVDGEDYKGEYINYMYESFPRTDNTSNLQSHDTVAYANINGETVIISVERV